MRWMLAAASTLLSVWVMAAAGGAGCGGKAVLDGPPGAGGAGGAGDTGGFAPNGPAGNQAQVGIVSTSSTPPPPPCILSTGDAGCDTCGSNSCPGEIAACCAATECLALVECVIRECSDGQDPTACAVSECSDEVSDAVNAGSIGAAQELGDCLSDSCGCG